MPLLSRACVLRLCSKFLHVHAYGTIIIITTFHPSCSDSILVGTAEVKLFSYECILAVLVHEGRSQHVILNKTEPLFLLFPSIRL